MRLLLRRRRTSAGMPAVVSIVACMWAPVRTHVQDCGSGWWQAGSDGGRSGTAAGTSHGQGGLCVPPRRIPFAGSLEAWKRVRPLVLRVQHQVCLCVTGREMSAVS